MIDSIKESILDNASQSELAAYLDSLFDLAMTTLQESHRWPLSSNDQPHLTTRYQRCISSQSDSPRLTRTHTYIQRHSKHDDLTLDSFRTVLLDPCQAAKYMSCLLETKPIRPHLFKNDTTQAGIYASRVQSTLTLPREYVDLVATRHTQGEIWVVTQPVETAYGPRKNHVRAQHVVWDHLCEKKDGVEWTRIEQVCLGGWIPCFVSDWTSGRVDDMDDLIGYIKYS